jgi:hypothetical protein
MITHEFKFLDDPYQKVWSYWPNLYITEDGKYAIGKDINEKLVKKDISDDNMNPLVPLINTKNEFGQELVVYKDKLYLSKFRTEVEYYGNELLPVNNDGTLGEPIRLGFWLMNHDNRYLYYRIYNDANYQVKRVEIDKDGQVINTDYIDTEAHANQVFTIGDAKIPDGINTSHRYGDWIYGIKQDTKENVRISRATICMEVIPRDGLSYTEVCSK